MRLNVNGYDCTRRRRAECDHNFRVDKRDISGEIKFIVNAEGAMDGKGTGRH